MQKNTLDLSLVQLTNEIVAPSKSSFMSDFPKVKNSARLVFSSEIVRNLKLVRHTTGTGLASPAAPFGIIVALRNGTVWEVSFEDTQELVRDKSIFVS